MGLAGGVGTDSPVLYLPPALPALTCPSVSLGDAVAGIPDDELDAMLRLLGDFP